MESDGSDITAEGLHVKRDRRIRLYVYTGLLSAALCAAAAVALIVVPGLLAATGAIPAGSVDINASVTSQTQCAPCHSLAIDSPKPGIIYNHRKHEAAVARTNATADCGACHWGPAHRPDLTVGSPKASCFVAGCHQVPYTSSPAISGKCSICHPKSFRLRPADHTKGYSGRPHVKPARADENSCLVCHAPKGFCDSCHREQGVKAKATKAAYEPVSAPAQPSRPRLLVDTRGKATMGQCVPCHSDIDRFPKTRVTFAHAKHFDSKSGKGFPARCEACHTRFSHVPDKTYRPDMPSCYACHGVSHVASATISTQKTVATVKCAACHPRSFVLKPKDHTASFAKKTHPKALAKRAESCNMCHESPFCVACHQGKPQGTRAVRPKVIPAGHGSSDFVGYHGKEYRKANATCSACHDGTTCRRCHKTALPHPADWLSSHPLSPALEAPDCNVCHLDKSTCQQCHHSSLKRAELLVANCVKCHPTIRNKSVAAIKNRGLAEHAAHFPGPKTKGLPLRCAACHVGFAMSVDALLITETKGHDTRLCYSCHGAKNDRGVLIAPYPGNTLCLRCHKDLKL